MKTGKSIFFVVLLLGSFSPSLMAQKTVRVNNGLSLGEPIEWVEGILNFFGLGSRNYRRCLGNRNGVTECLGAQDGAKFVKSSYTDQELTGAAEMADLIDKGVDCEPFGPTEFVEPRNSHVVSFKKCGAYFLYDIDHYDPNTTPMTKVYSCHKFFCDPKVMEELKKVGNSEDRPDSSFPALDDPETYYGCSIAI